MKDTRETRKMVMQPPQTNTVGGVVPPRRSSAESAAGAAAIRRNELSITSFFQKKDDNTRKNEKDEDNDCPICLNKFKDASCTTQCGHRYCADCLTKHWKNKKGNLDCPYCRQRITMLVPN